MTAADRPRFDLAAGPDLSAHGAFTRIGEYLKAKGIDALVAMILEYAERDPMLFRRLDAAAATTGADERTLETRLRKAIDTAPRCGRGSAASAT